MNVSDTAPAALEPVVVASAPPLVANRAGRSRCDIRRNRTESIDGTLAGNVVVKGNDAAVTPAFTIAVVEDVESDVEVEASVAIRGILGPLTVIGKYESNNTLSPCVRYGRGSNPSGITIGEPDFNETVPGGRIAPDVNICQPSIFIVEFQRDAKVNSSRRIGSTPVPPLSPVATESELSRYPTTTGPNT